MIITCVSHQWMIAPILHQNRLNQWQTTLELAACPQKVASIWPHWNCAAGFTSLEIWQSFADRCPKIYKISPGKLWHVTNHQCGCSHGSHPFNESCATCTAEKLRTMWPWHHNEQPSMAWLKANLIGQPWIYPSNHAISLYFFSTAHQFWEYQGWLGPLLPGIPRLVSMKASGITATSRPFLTPTSTMGHDQLGTSGRQIINPSDHKARPSQLWHGSTLFFSSGPDSQATRLPFPSFRGFLGGFRCIRLYGGRGVVLRLRLLGILGRGVAGHATVGLLTLLGLGETAEGGVHGFVILRGHLLQLLPFLYCLGPRIFPNPVETNGDRVFPNLPSSCWNHLEGQQTHQQSCVALQTGSFNKNTHL